MAQRRFAATVAAVAGKAAKAPAAPAAAAAAATATKREGGKSAALPAASGKAVPAAAASAGNPAYDEAVRWFAARRDQQQARLVALEGEITAATAAGRAARDALEAARGGPGEAVRQAQHAVKAAEQALHAASREHQSLKIHLWRTDPVRERKARRLEETFELPDIRTMDNAAWTEYGEPTRILSLANYWKVIPDVLPAGASTSRPPTVNLLVDYPSNELVYRGNVLTPTKTATSPAVRFNSGLGEKLYTLALVDADAPDTASHRYRERCHWLLTNLSASTALAAGSAAPADATAVAYVPPHPESNTGMHRLVFCLLEQSSGRLDPAQLAALATSPDRYFSTSALMERHRLTLSGLAFFRAEWDTAVTDIYTSKLGRAEPVYAPRPPSRSSA